MAHAAPVIEQQPGSRHLVIEAETATILNPDATDDVRDNAGTGRPEDPPQVWKVVELGGASGGKVLQAPGQPHRSQDDAALQESIAVYTLKFASAGRYKLYIRGSNNGTPENGSSDSIWVATDFGTADPAKSRSLGTTGSLEWLTNIGPAFTVRDADVGEDLELRIGVRESGARVDAMVMSSDQDLTAARLHEILTGQSMPAAAVAAASGVSPTGAASAPGAMEARAPVTRTVSTVKELEAAVRDATPGSTIVMTAGEWRDAELVFDGTRSANGRGGTSEEQPITLKAAEPGKTVLTGKSTLRIAGDHMVVSGLLFERGGLDGGTAVVQFRNGSSRPATNSRLTETAIIGYNAASPETRYEWVGLYGENNRVDHCWFSGMNHRGVQMVVWINPDGPPNRSRIDNNYFGDRTLGTGNGFETIRIGDSHTSFLRSEAVVERNLFQRCDGEVEIISNKSVANVYRGNTFRENAGQLTLRHGSECLVEQNFFFGENKENSSGVRIIGPDHVVVNNYFEGLRGQDFYAALSIVNGVPNSPLNRYLTAERNLVAFNTFVDCAEGITIGLVSSVGDNIVAPVNNTIANNVMQLSGGQVAYKYITPPVDTRYEGNLWYGGATAIADTEGIVQRDPQLARAADGLMRPAQGSPVIGSAVGSYPLVVQDMDGQPRVAPIDAGADQSGSAAIVHRPLTTGDVGPRWMRKSDAKP